MKILTERIATVMALYLHVSGAEAHAPMNIHALIRHVLLPAVPPDTEANNLIEKIPTYISSGSSLGWSEAYFILPDVLLIDLINNQ